MPRKSRRGSGSNRAAIRRLRGYAVRANTWFFVWIGVLVGGPVVACAGINIGDMLGIACCFAGMFSPFVALGGMFLMVGDRGRWNRALGFAEEGDDLDLDYTEEPGRGAAAFLRGCATIGDADHELLRNRLEGRFRGRRMQVMDYRSGYGKSSVAYRTTIVWDGEAGGVPRFALFPRGWRRRLAEAVGLGGSSIRLRGERQFNDAYTLLGADPDEVAACFGEDLVNLCVRERGIVIEARDGSLLVYWDGEEFPPRQLADRLAVAYRVLRLLVPDDGGADADAE